MDPKLYVKQLENLFEANKDEKNAVPMKRYMRDQFEYYGIKSPLRRELLRQFLKENDKPSGEGFKQIVKKLWENDHREMQYVAMDIMEKVVRKMDDSFLPFLEKLILQKSWWDTVDWIAPNGFGRVFQKYPHHIKPTTKRWIQSDNIWLQRSAIIFQLKYGEKTDYQLMFDYILYRAESNEFFVKKGSGWALRQYSKYNARAVIEFIKNHEDILSNLTKKEGLKWLERNQRN
jgi:3-methyladenine DNA glycosylase AlkD